MSNDQPAPQEDRGPFLADQIVTTNIDLSRLGATQMDLSRLRVTGEPSGDSS